VSSDIVIEQRSRRNWEDLVFYIKDLVILQNPPSNWGFARVQPTAGGR
jgi:hypothetical protein